LSGWTSLSGDVLCAPSLIKSKFVSKDEVSLMAEENFESQAHDINHKILENESEKIAFVGNFTNLLSIEMMESAQALKEEGLIWK
jgi:hypothetical protein